MLMRKAIDLLPGDVVKTFSSGHSYTVTKAVVEDDMVKVDFTYGTDHACGFGFEPEHLFVIEGGY